MSEYSNISTFEFWGFEVKHYKIHDAAVLFICTHANSNSNQDLSKGEWIPCGKASPGVIMLI